MNESKKRLNVVITSDLHRDLKITAVKQGTTLSRFVIEAVTEKMENQKGNEINVTE